MPATAYRPSISIAILLEPYRRALDFHGRSTRTEALLFLVSAAGLGALIVSAANLLGLISTMPDWSLRAFLAEEALALLPILPILALLVRRMHDMALPGWPALFLPIPAIGLNRWQEWHALGVKGVAAPPELAWLLQGAAVLAIFAILLAPPARETSRYGPDPRTGS